MLVPMKFEVAEGDTNYPQSTWGMPLGIMTMTIRNGLSMKVRLPLLPFIPSLCATPLGPL